LVNLNKIDFAKEYREECCKNVVFVDAAKERKNKKLRIFKMPILLNFLNNSGIFVNMYYLDKAVPEGLAPLFEIASEKFNLEFINNLADAMKNQVKHYSKNNLCVGFVVKNGEARLQCFIDCFNGKVEYNISYPNFYCDNYKEPEIFLSKVLEKVSVLV
jgi:hypothetical protein